MNKSINSHISAENQILEVVWYEGTDALKEGEGLCYNADYGTATAANARRGNIVERPSSSNNNNFAGVAARNYSAVSTGGRLIEICIPGSVCKVALGIDTVVNTGIVTCQAGGAAGRFTFAGYKGRGSAVPLQTVTAVLERTVDGTGSLATDGVTLTVADSSDMSIGDTVVFLGSEDEGASKTIVAGKYTIASITDSTTIVLSATAVSATPAAALTCSFYIYTGNPTCLARLLDGEESGLVEMVSPPNAGVVGLAYMAGGVSYINGGVTLAADADVTLADGVNLGDKKGFVCMGTMTTSDVTVDLATAGVGLVGTTLAEVNAIDAAADAAYFEWTGLWRTVMVVGGATEA